jgi:uncharacterized SAM-binding protein YcdF (DUF218 family)
MAACGLVGATWLIVSFTPVVLLLTRGWPRRDAPAPADAIFVLASSVQRNGDPTPQSLGRLVHAIELVGEHRATRLIVSEVPPSPSYERMARALLDHLGITAEVLSVGPVRNTHDEAVATAGLCRRRGFRKILLVTSLLHSRRAAAVFERQGLMVISDPSPELLFNIDEPDSAEERLRAFAAVMHERIGLWIYRLRGWT